MDIESMHRQYEKLLKEGNCYPVAYRPALARLAGSVNDGVMLSQALYWTFRTGPDGWFYKKPDDWELETGLSRHEQTGARRLLREKGLIEEKVRRAPPVVHFRVNLPKVLQGIHWLELRNGSAKPTHGKPCSATTGGRHIVPMRLRNTPLWLYFKSVKSSEKSVKL
jgi:hypothetical protein